MNRCDFFKFIFFCEYTSDEQTIDLEVDAIFTRNNMRCETGPDGLPMFPIFQFINAVELYPIDDQYGKTKTTEILHDHRAELKDYGIHDMKNQHGRPSPAMNYNGLKAILNYLTGEFATRYKKHSIKTTTRFEAGDKSMHNDLDANAASSNMLNQMARDVIALEVASGGARIAPPLEVPVFVNVCSCCTCADIGTA